MKSVLVIGYGNTLRGDDGAGVQAAELIAERHPEIACIYTHQLTPELAERIAESDIVFFIDAQVELQEVTARLIEPKTEIDQPRTHFFSPASLLSFSQQLYGRTPSRAYLVGIPASEFEFSEHVSSATAKAIIECMNIVDRLLSSK
jgi:hydrogenase maturation protease